MNFPPPRFPQTLPWLLGAWPLAALGAEVVGPGSGRAIFAVLAVHYALAALLIAQIFIGPRPSPVTTAVKSYKVIVLLLLMEWAALTTLLHSQNTVFGLLKLTELAVFFLVGVAAAHICIRDGAPVFLRGFNALATGLVIALVLAMAADITFAEAFEDRRVPGFVHIRIFGFSATIAIAIATASLATSSDARGSRWFAMLLLTTGWTVLFWSASRGGMVALILAFAFLAVFLAPVRRVWLLWILALGMGFGLSFLFPGAGDSGTQTIFDHELTVNSLSTGRWSLWQQVLSLISVHPLTGHGYAQYHSLMVTAGRLPENVMPHTHNIVLEAALAIGWPATGVLASLTAWAWAGWLRQVRAQTDELSLASLMTASTLGAYAFVDGVYFYPESAIVFALSAGILSSRSQHQLSVDR